MSDKDEEQEDVNAEDESSEEESSEESTGEEAEDAAAEESDESEEVSEERDSEEQAAEDGDVDESEEESEDDSEEDDESDEDDSDEEDSEDEEDEDEEESEADEKRGETYQEMVDRRQSGRKGVKLSRLISSKIIDGESERECYLHLVDISDGGFRINSDDPFPEDREFVLEIGLAPFGNELATKSPKQAFPVKVVWTRSLVGGMVVSGLAFQNLSEDGKEVVSKIMQGASPQGRRMHFRLNRVLGVELGKEEDEDQQWLYPLTLDLSVEGMRICLSDPLEVGAKFPIKVFLEFELPTVQAHAEVMWQETMPSGRVQVGLKFDEMSERDAMAIKTYIDQCLSQDEAHRRL